MPRTIDEAVQQMLGAQALTIARLQVEIETLAAKLDALTPPPAGQPAPTNGDA